MDLAEKLLDAHVAHEVAALRGERFIELVSSEVDHALRVAGELTLDQVMTADQVKAVATKYVATFRLPGAIPEIAGEIAQRVRTHPANDTLLGELVSRPRVVELVDVLAEMRGLRERVLRGIVDSSSLQAGVGGMVHGIATGMFGSGRRFAGRVPGVAQGVTAAEKVAGKVAGGMIEGADLRSRELAEQAAGLLIGYVGNNAATAVSDEELKAAVLELWDALALRPISELTDAVDDDQLVELLVAVYQCWLDLRVSGYLTALVETGVEYFFDTYGGYRLDRLLEEFGLGRADLVEEALRFGPPVIEALYETGDLQDLVRRRLVGFYTSPEAAEILQG